MSRYLGRTPAICDRCRLRYGLDELNPDGNAPGMRVCPQCRDDLDPYRLPPRKTEDIRLRHPRPDENIEVPQ